MTAKEEEELQLIEDWHLGAHHCDDEGFGCEIEEFEGNGPGAVGKYFRCKLERESYQSLRNTLSQQHELEITKARKGGYMDGVNTNKIAINAIALQAKIDEARCLRLGKFTNHLFEHGEYCVPVKDIDTRIEELEAEQQSNGGEIK